MLYSNIAFGQDSLLIKGYVVGMHEIQPDVQVSVMHKNTTINTDFKGRFEIYCSIGDTLFFEKKNSKLIVEKYVVSDNLPLIIDLWPLEYISKSGAIRLHNYTYTKAIVMPKISVATSIFDKNVFSIEYNFLPKLFFPDKPYIPIFNNILLGVNLSNDNNKFYLFPNIGFFVKNYYTIFDSGISFLFPKPVIKVGYWINELKSGKNGFGIELGVSLLDFSVHSSSDYDNFSADLKYNNYLTRNGCFMISINLKKEIRYNKIPKFLKKQMLL
jgi:hypothetical protein